MTACVGPRPIASAAVVIVMVAWTSIGYGDDWPQFRGPGGNGVCAVARLPLRWSVLENVRFRPKLPGRGFSSPILCGDRVYVTTAYDEGRRRSLLALDRSTGATLWERFVVDENPEPTSAMTGYAAATPTTDGRHIVAFFGNAGLAAWDPTGRLLWQHKLGVFETELGLASSPILDAGAVIQVCDHDGSRFTSFDSYLIAVEVATGKVLWKTDRPKLERSWSTPCIVTRGGHREIVVCAQEGIRGYDRTDGRLLWEVLGLSGWVAPSPVVAGERLYATSGKDGPTLALDLSGAAGSAPRIVWRHESGGSYVSSPVVYGDVVYLLHEAGFLTCLEAASGRRIFRERLRGKFTASPVVAGEHLLAINEDGMTYVIEAGRQFRLVARNPLDEYCLASPALDSRGLWIRTEHSLWRIEASPSPK